MPTWRRLGTRDELLAQVPYSVKLDRHRIALFHHGGFRAIADGCNHRGGPLSEGRLRDEFVMCPWHGWEYSVITGRGPEGFDEEQVPVFAVEERADGVWVKTPPVMPRKLLKHKPSHLLEDHPKPAGAPPRVLGLSTTAMDAGNPRYSTSDALLEHAIAHAGSARDAETRLVRLRDLDFRPCEGNYSKASHALHLALRHHRARTGRPAHRGLRGTGALGRRGAHLDLDPLGRRERTLLQDGRAAQLRAEPDHDPQQGAHQQQGGRVHHHRRPGQRAGGRGGSADLLVASWASCSPSSRSSRTPGAGTRRTCRTTSARCA